MSTGLPKYIHGIAALHYVSDDTALDMLKPWVISSKSFIHLLDYIQEHGYNTVRFEDVINGKLQDKCIILTFDDCPKHLWDFAIPELLRRNMKAVFYMPTACLGGYNEWNVKDGLPRIELMDENDIAKLVSVGMEVGSHAHNHIMLEEQEEHEVIHQLTISKSMLEKIIKKPVLTVAYPYGSVPSSAGRLSEFAGYRYGLSVFTPWESRYAIRRWIYDDTDTYATINYKLSPSYRWFRAVEDKRNRWVKKLTQSMYRLYSSVKKSVKLKTLPIIMFTEGMEYAEILAVG